MATAEAAPSSAPASDLKPDSSHFHILSLPPEILQHLLLTVTSPTFLQLTLTCRQLFALARESRAILLHHLHQLPGLKFGLSDPASISTPDLFVTLRRRAAAHLYGVNFTADCTDYAFKHATLDADACVLAEGREYINVALALKESLTVRLYGGRCVRKEVIESPYGDGRGTILKILQWNTTITVLYSWIDEDEVVLAGGSSNRSPWDRIKNGVHFSRKLRRRRRSISPSYPPPPSSASSSLSRDATPSPSRQPSFSEINKDNLMPLKYHLLHYNAYSFSKPIFFSIPRHKEHLVPVSVAVSGRLRCAILWDLEGSIKPTTHAEILLYTADHVPRGEEGLYDTSQVWPLRSVRDRDGVVIERPPTLTNFFPKSIALFHDGYRLALYAPGQIVPYEVISTNGSMSRTLSNSVLLGRPGNLWTIDRPFWGNHETYSEKVEREDDADGEGGAQEERTYCQHTYLCLGTTIMDGVKIAGVLRSRTRKDHDECRHLIDYDGMPHTNVNSKLVARLWGWKESLCTLPGVVAWSGWTSSVRLVAIADWDQIFIWPVAVGELGEEFEGENTDDANDAEDESSDGGDGDGDGAGDATTITTTTTVTATTTATVTATSTATATATAKGKGKQKEEEDTEQPEVKGYYERIWDDNLQASVVELRPVVLKMKNGGVVRKMVWSRHTDGDESEDEAEDSELVDDPEIEVTDIDTHHSAGEAEPRPLSDGQVESAEPGGDGNTEQDAEMCNDALPASGGVAQVDEPVPDAPATEETTRTDEKQKGKKKKRPPPGLRLKVLTDRGVSIWELGVWAKGKGKKGWLDEVIV